MPKLYVANLSKQKQDFCYIVPETKRLQVQTIPIGQQVMVHMEDTMEVLRGIVDQHLKYGMVAYDEIDRTRRFIGMCFRFDKPVDIERIQRGVSQNDAVLVAAGSELRKQAAVSLNNTLDITGAGLRNVETEVMEEDSQGKPAGRSEKFRVAREGFDPDNVPAARGRGRRAA